MFFAPPTVKAISRYSDFGSHLGVKSFGAMFVLAVVLHACLIGIYAMIPNEKIVKIPVRVLNINLGANMGESAPPSEQPVAGQSGYDDLPPPPPKAVSDDTPLPLQKAPQVELDKALAEKNEAHEAAVKVHAERVAEQKKIREAAREKMAAERKEAADKRKAARVAAAAEPAKPAAPVVPKQYVRGSPLDLTTPKGNATVTADSQAAAKPEEMARRYTQDISQWIKQRRVYPEEAKKRRAEGVAIVRLRVNRQGHVLYYVIEKSTGDAFLDSAAMSMVRASDPLPALPENYPGADDVLEFRVPVTFTLEK